MINKTPKKETHNIKPVYDNKSQILILGSFPSVQSRKLNFYYGHPQNRFWKIMSILYNQKDLDTTDKKIEFLLSNHIALWDVIKSCDIIGSADSSITNVIPNDIEIILNFAKIEKIYVNGDKAYSLYKKYLFPKLKIEAIKLPSTSPLNAKYQLDKLCEIWSVIKNLN